MPLVLGEPIANVLNLEAERLLFSSCQKLSASTGGDPQTPATAPLPPLQSLSEEGTRAQAVEGSWAIRVSRWGLFLTGLFPRLCSV